jgi:hypothetical protein
MDGTDLTLAEAVAVLCERCHNGRSDWKLDRGFHSDLRVTVPGPEWRDYILTPFEALAVATFYVQGHSAEDADTGAGVWIDPLLPHP